MKLFSSFKNCAAPRVLRQHDVVLARERNEASIWDSSRNLAAKCNRLSKIITDVHDQRRRPHLRQQVPNVELGNSVEITHRAIRRSAQTLQFIESVRLLPRGGWHHRRRK